MAKVEFSSRKKAKLKEVLVRLEDHLECVCTSQHHVMEHVEADTGIYVMHTYKRMFSLIFEWLFGYGVCTQRSMALCCHHRQTHLLVSLLLPNVNVLCELVFYCAGQWCNWMDKKDRRYVWMLKHVEVCLRFLLQVQQVSAFVCRDKRVGST